MKDSPEESSFEKGVNELDALVRRLDSGELSLEEALAAFEAGVGLVRNLTERLNQAEARIEALVRSASGSLEKRPLQIEEEEA